MRGIIKGKWFVLFAWIAAIVLLFVFSPNMGDLVREKGQIEVPDGYSSSLATKILDEIKEQDGTSSGLQTALVFHNKNGLTNEDMKNAEDAIQKLNAQKEKLGITDIITHFDQKELEDQLVSEDNKTILVSLSIDPNNRTAREISDELYQALEDVNIEHYYTGSWMIDEALVTNSQEGLKKTEWITVVFILVVLLLVFRSVITPIIPLITVGISYIVAQSIVAILVDLVNFPLSTFTQIFLVAVLFGIGTDYCILLLSRYKEELSHFDSVTEAIVTTYKTAGKTVLFSGLAVMIGFASIGFSQFKLYQSASAVAIGIAVLLLALVTVVPFFMSVFGKKLFWPAKGKLEHKESKLWQWAGTFSFTRPIITLLIVAAVTVPFIITYDGELSFNSLEEISDDYDAIKGFNIVSDSFGPGQSMPTQIVLKNDDELDQAEYIALIEEISKEIEKIEHVDTVRSVTRPTGEKIEDLLVAKQAEMLEEGLGQGNDGLKQISDGLSQAESEILAQAPQLDQATDGIRQLVQGTNELKLGLGELKNGLQEIENGLHQGTLGAKEMKTRLEELKTNAETLLEGNKQLLEGYRNIQSNLETSILAGYQGIEEKYLSVLASITPQDLAELEKNNPGILVDMNYHKIKSLILALHSNDPVQNPLMGIKALNNGLASIIDGLTEANRNFATLIENQKKVNDALGLFIEGIQQQIDGLNQMADGQKTIIGHLSQFDEGLGSINQGQTELLNGFSDLSSQMNQLTDGLNQSVLGIRQVSQGLLSAQDYLANLSKNERDSIFIPEEVLTSKEFQPVLDLYMSNDRKTVTFDVVFESNPYSNDAINKIEEMKDAVKRATKGTKLENATLAIGGVTSTYNDLGTISDEDYSRTVMLMMIGIFIILIILLRSFIMPIYLITSLILTYFTSMGLTEMIFVNLLGYSGLSWAVPFFAFVILIALGVDYSIFLMDRFNEYKEYTIKEAMILSMRKMGTVIISAAVILGGTFAAMLPSGVLSLLEIATITLTGLFLYALFMLPLFVPVMVKTFGKANWWPFLGEK